MDPSPSGRSGFLVSIESVTSGKVVQVGLWALESTLMETSGERPSRERLVHMNRKRVIGFVVVLSVFGVSRASGGDVEPGAVDAALAHRIVARESIEALPTEIATLFRKHGDDFVRHAAAPALEWPSDPDRRRCRRWHRVESDIAARDQQQAARLAALKVFPRDRSSAKRLYRGRGRLTGGSLPWAIEECYNKLVRAFRSGRASFVIERAGHLAHFAADASDPFRCTANGDGKLTGNPRFGAVRGEHLASAEASVRERFGVGLVGRYAETYADAVQVTRTENDPTDAPVEAAFDTLAASLAVVDEIAEADRAILEQLQIIDRGAFEARRDAYYAALDERCGKIRIGRLSAGAALAANLISGAWQEAGSPNIEAGRAVPSARGRDAASARRLGKFVGSKRSNVVHLPSCRHAARIAEGNLVHFKSLREARSQGRRGCKVCKPK